LQKLLKPSRQISIHAGFPVASHFFPAGPSGRLGRQALLILDYVSRMPPLSQSPAEKKKKIP